MADEIAVPAAPAVSAVSVAAARSMSLDTFRGLTIAAMMLVNNAGDWSNVWHPLGHASWHGITPTDFIYPFFLFIMGVAMTFSFARRLETGTPRRSFLLPVLRRTAILFAIGTFLGLSNFVLVHSRGTMRVSGVLQRIAICYFFASLIALWGGTKGEVAAFVGLLVGYWLLMRFVPVPGAGAGSLTRGANLATWVDHHVFGASGYTFDAASGTWHEPEGLLSTLPAIATTLSGLLTGAWLRRKSSSGYEKAAGMLAVAFPLVALGYLWAEVFPLNKNLWTSSYVLYTTGWALGLFGFCYWLVDLRGRRGWTKPFVAYGMNAIVIYAGGSFLSLLTLAVKWTGPDGAPVTLKTWLYERLFASWIPALTNAQVASAAYGVAWVVLMGVVAWVLYKKKIFVKI